MLSISIIVKRFGMVKTSVLLNVKEQIDKWSATKAL
jgi:hypothetical protein